MAKQGGMLIQTGKGNAIDNEFTHQRSISMVSGDLDEINKDPDIIRRKSLNKSKKSLTVS